ncbi:MAG: hypothetical protein H2039_00810 [Brevundimonas sp.]|nr:hypothetical protein [Brevundimonas sp.]
MTINAPLFAAAGQALFGDEWKRPLAALLGMNDRTVFRIAAAARDGADYPVNPDLGPILAQHLAKRATEAEAQAKEARRLAKLLSE